MVRATRRARRRLGKREKHRRHLSDVIRLHYKGYGVSAISTITGRSTPIVQRAVDTLKKIETEKDVA
jgi:hypothetical protein